MAVDKQSRRLKIRKGIRKILTGTTERPRLSVFKSNKAIYAQLIDDDEGQTLVSFSSGKLELKGNNNVVSSKEVGLKLAELATKKGIKKAVFDRGGYRYHGQVKALADGAREGGLEF